MGSFLQEASGIAAGMIDIRRRIHRRPEPGRREVQTAALVEDELRALGLSPRRAAGTGVTADITGMLPGPVVALRADMDALPIRESTGLPYASENDGWMHACGHDLHTAALLGAARLLCARRGQLRGTVRLLFQPDEENDGGAERMIAEGCMNGVSAVFGAHCAPELPCGTVAFCPGKAYAASNPFDIIVHGRSAHGAEPHLGTDAVSAAAAVVTALHSIVDRELDPFEPAVITIGRFQAGSARNVIADEARLSGILRCFGPQMRARLTERVRAIAEGTARAHGAEAEVSFVWGYGGIINDPGATRFARETAGSLLGPEQVTDYPPTLTTEDFGFFLDKAPGTFWHLGVGRPGTGCTPLHTPTFDPDEDALVPAAALHAQIAWRWLETHA